MLFSTKKKCIISESTKTPRVDSFTTRLDDSVIILGRSNSVSIERNRASERLGVAQATLHLSWWTSAEPSGPGLCCFHGSGKRF